MGEMEVSRNPQSKSLPANVSVLSPHDRLMELEYENKRLQRLVAELLARNQQLRANS